MARFKINDFGIPDRILKSAALRREVDNVAEEIADNMRAANIRVEGVPGDVELPIEVDSYETDRARATVWIAHPSGVAVQAKHGIATRAASQAGHRVRGS